MQFPPPPPIPANLSLVSSLFCIRCTCVFNGKSRGVQTIYTCDCIHHVPSPPPSPPAIDDSGLKETKAYKAVFTALKNHRLDVNTQSGGLLALANLLRDDCFAAINSIHCQDHLVILDALKTHSTRANVVAHGLRALQTLARCAIDTHLFIHCTCIITCSEPL